jgi:hypothetical protein
VGLLQFGRTLLMGHKFMIALFAVLRNSFNFCVCSSDKKAKQTARQHNLTFLDKTAVVSTVRFLVSLRY